MKGRTMADNYVDDDYETDDEQESIPSLRRAANKSKKLEAELRELRKELAFAKAGIKLDDPKMKYFVKGYDGEMDPEEIRAAASEAGFLQVQTSEAPAEEAQPNPAVQAQERVMTASAGAMAEDVSEAAAISRMESAMAEGGIDALLEVVQQYGIPVAYDQ